jgi:hypothetical protein
MADDRGVYAGLKEAPEAFWAEAVRDVTWYKGHFRQASRKLAPWPLRDGLEL